MKILALSLILVAACSNSLNSLDYSTVADNAKSNLSAYKSLESDGGVGQARALIRKNYCGDISIQMRHSQPVSTDPAITCTAPTSSGGH